MNTAVDIVLFELEANKEPKMKVENEIFMWLLLTPNFLRHLFIGIQFCRAAACAENEKRAAGACTQIARQCRGDRSCIVYYILNPHTGKYGEQIKSQLEIDRM